MLLKTAYNIPCLLHFVSLVSRVTLDVLNFETSVRFYLVLSVFTFDAVGSLDYSEEPSYWCKDNKCRVCRCFNFIEAYCIFSLVGIFSYCLLLVLTFGISSLSWYCNGDVMASVTNVLVQEIFYTPGFCAGGCYSLVWDRL